MLGTLKVSVFDVVRHHNIMDEGFLALSSPELCRSVAKNGFKTFMKYCDTFKLLNANHQKHLYFLFPVLD